MSDTERLDRLWRELYEIGGAHVIQEIVQLDKSQVFAKRYGMTLLHVAAGH